MKRIIFQKEAKNSFNINPERGGLINQKRAIKRPLPGKRGDIILRNTKYLNLSFLL